ncbi:hypothetical protein RRG08_058474 [Elysia crispata]|uniref:Uncharacterized protein n=1 Tax=Elysia crispata TaxID=231223 RepID=A0AAE0Y715_9GAST|nr:hypothetical protein RRG08_058474 [Elysia crispata]
MERRDELLEKLADGEQNQLFKRTDRQESGRGASVLRNCEPLKAGKINVILRHSGNKNHQTPKPLIHPRLNEVPSTSGTYFYKTSLIALKGNPPESDKCCVASMEFSALWAL